MKKQTKLEENHSSIPDKTVVLLAAPLVKDVTNISEKVRTLSNLGLDVREMARACGTTEATIRARMADIHKSQAKVKAPNE